MADAPVRVSLEEFARNLGSFFDRVAQNQETAVVENGAGASVEVRPIPATRRHFRRTEPDAADYAAFLSSLGGWRDVDVDTVLQQGYESRDLPSPKG